MQLSSKMVDYLEGLSATSRISLSPLLGVVAGIVAAFFTVAQAAVLIGS